MVSTHPTGNALGGRPARQNWGKFDAHNWEDSTPAHSLLRRSSRRKKAAMSVAGKTKEEIMRVISQSELLRATRLELSPQAAPDRNRTSVLAGRFARTSDRAL